MNGVKLEQCKKTKAEVFNKIITCYYCNLVPIPIIRDKMIIDRVYCKKCANLYRTSVNLTMQEDNLPLNDLIIDCKRFCGEIFKYYEINDVMMKHENECEFPNNISLKKNTCQKCRKQISGMDHDCILETNKRINSVEKFVKENIQIINQEINENATNFENNKELIKVQIDRISDQIKELNNRTRFNEERYRIKESNTMNFNTNPSTLLRGRMDYEFESNDHKSEISEISDLRNFVNTKVTELEKSYFRLNSRLSNMEHDYIKIKDDIQKISQPLKDKFFDEIPNNKNENRSVNESFINTEINSINNKIDENQREKDIIKNQIKKIEEGIEKENILSKFKIKKIENDIRKLLNEFPNHKLSALENKNLLDDNIDMYHMSDINSKGSNIEKNIKELQSLYFTLENSFNESSNQINEKIHSNISVLDEINLKFRSFVQEEKSTDNIFTSDIESLKKEVKNLRLSFQTLLINELLNKMKSIPNGGRSKTMFKSLIKSDIFNINTISSSIECLRSIHDLENFNKQYDLVQKSIENSSKNAILFGNIKNTKKNAHTHPISSMIVKEDMIISCSIDCSIKVWGINKKTPHKEIPNAHSGEFIFSLLHFKDKNRIISGGNDNQIRFWDDNYDQVDFINNGSQIRKMLLNNFILIVGNYDKTINFYDLKTKYLVNKLKTDHGYWILKLLLLNSKDILLSGSLDASIKVWNVKNYSINNYSNSNNCITTLRFHSGGIESLLQLDYDPNILVSADYSGKIVFSEINKNYQIMRQFEISHYDENPNNSDNYNYMNMYESKIYKMLITITSGSSLLFWNLSDFNILRNVSFKTRLRTIIGFENEEGIIFSQGLKNNIIIWK